MKEKIMAVSIIGMVIGLVVAITGLVYLGKAKGDKESQKIYGIISGIGGLVFVGMLVKLLLEVL